MRVAADQLTVRFGARTVLDELSMVIEGAGAVAVMGPSGSGKSTLLSVIAGQLVPDEGRVEVTGDFDRVEWVFQSAPLLSRRSALDNVVLGALTLGIGEVEADARARWAMSELGVLGLASQAGYRLSGGERQRIAIARVLAARPRLVLADEPTASLDATARGRVVEALLAIVDVGGLVVVATHDEYVAARCSRVVRLVDGRAAG